MNMSPAGESSTEAAHSSSGPHETAHSELLTPHFPIDRRAWIARTAYGMAERRGFDPGHELENWLAAEKQVQFEVVGEGRTF